MFGNSQLFHSLNQQVRFLNKEINERLKKHGIYHSQWAILYCLYTYGPMTQTVIWQYLNVEAPTVTRTLKRMEANNWIIRKQGKDKRERLIELTEAARDKFHDIEKSVNCFEEDMLVHLTSEEQDQLLRLINKVGYKGAESP